LQDPFNVVSFSSEFALPGVVYNFGVSWLNLIAAQGVLPDCLWIPYSCQSHTNCQHRSEPLDSHRDAIAPARRFSTNKSPHGAHGTHGACCGCTGLPSWMLAKEEQLPKRDSHSKHCYFRSHTTAAASGNSLKDIAAVFGVRQG